MYGQDIQKGEEGDADLLGPAVAQDLHQADQAAVWSEQVPNALAHLWQRSCDWLCLGVPASQLISNGASWLSAGRHCDCLCNRKADLQQ